MGTCHSHTEYGVPKTGFKEAGITPCKPRHVATNSSDLPNPTGGKLLFFSSKHSNVATLVSPSAKTHATVPETPSYQLVSPGSNFNFVSPMPEGARQNEGITLSTEDNESAPPMTPVYHGTPSPPERASGEEMVNDDEEILHVIENSSPKLLLTPLPQTSIRHLQDDTHPLTDGQLPQKNRTAKLANKRARQAAQLHLLNRRITRPDSIVFRSPPLVVPPKGSEPTRTHVQESDTSVAPNTIANFNRLKVQVQLAERHELHQRRRAKLKDRYQDVKEYRSLWKDFEHIQDQVQNNVVHSDINDELCRAVEGDVSLDLQKPSTWYFDFGALKTNRHIDSEDDYDNQSSSSLSLLNETSMKVQKEYFKQKRLERKKKKRRGGKTATIKRKAGESSDDLTVSSARSYIRPGDASVLSKKRDYGPVTETANTPVMEISYVASDESTPRTRTGGNNDDQSRGTHVDDLASVISDLGMDNDYNVPRRRSRSHRDDSSVETFEDTRTSIADDDLSEFRPRLRAKSLSKKRHNSKGFAMRNQEYEHSFRCTLSPERKKEAESKSVPKPMIPPISTTKESKQYGFDPSTPLSSQLELFAQSVPSVRIDDAKAGIVRWREFSDDPSQRQKTACRLDGFFANEGAHATSKAKIDGDVHEDAKRITTPVDQTRAHDQAAILSDKPCFDNPPALAYCDEVIEQYRSSDAHAGMENIQQVSQMKTPVLTGVKDRSHVLPYAIMSSEQFFMMSEIVMPSSYDSPTVDEVSLEEENSVSRKGHAPLSPPKPADSEKEKKEWDHKHQDESIECETNPYKVLISNLSTEDFLRMSTWHSYAMPCNQSVLHDDDESCTMKESTLYSCSNANESESDQKGENESRGARPEIVTKATPIQTEVSRNVNEDSEVPNPNTGK